MQRLALNVPNAEQRERFITEATTLLHEKAPMVSGIKAKLIEDAAGRVIPDIELRAITELLAVTIPDPQGLSQTL